MDVLPTPPFWLAITKVRAIRMPRSCRLQEHQVALRLEAGYTQLHNLGHAMARRHAGDLLERIHPFHGDHAAPRRDKVSGLYHEVRQLRKCPRHDDIEVHARTPLLDPLAR